MGNKKIIIVVMAIVLTAIASVLGFDYSAYKPSSLKEIGDKAKERVGCNVKVTKDEKPGFDFYLEKLRVGIRLTDYPLELSKGEFNIEKINILEYYFNTFSINR